MALLGFFLLYLYVLYVHTIHTYIHMSLQDSVLLSGDKKDTHPQTQRL